MPSGCAARPRRSEGGPRNRDRSCLRAAFGAEELGERFLDPDGKLIHADLRIGGSVVMIAQSDDEAKAPVRSPESLGGFWYPATTRVWARCSVD
jgi:hypothetical protein